MKEHTYRTNIGFRAAYEWFFSTYPEMKYKLTPQEKLLYNMKITARSRYNASSRLEWEKKISFFTTTLLSLGLIFIPLAQNAKIKLAFDPSLLNMMQIFLAVSVLVYSVLNGMTRYETRIEDLRTCADNIRDLIREYRSEDKVNADMLKRYSARYNVIVTTSENHNSNDYLFSRLELRDEIRITGLRRLFLYSKYIIIYLIPFFLPIILLAFELTFILDMLGATHFYKEVFSMQME